MKLHHILAVGALALSVTFTACGGGENATNTAADADKAPAAEPKTEVSESTVNINTGSSVVKWKGEMLGIYDHTGTLDFTDGTVMMKGDQITGGKFTVDMTSMAATDENYNPDEGHGPEQLIGHLASADFFDVENNPTAAFAITKVEGDKAMGDLTIRGTTKPVTVENIQVKEEGGMKKMMGTLVFDRQEFGITYKVDAADKVLSDDIELEIELVAGEAAM